MNRELIAFLSKIHPFTDLLQEELEEVGLDARLEPAPAGAVLVPDREDERSLYVVRDGTLRVMVDNEIIDTLIRGDFFGHVQNYFPSPSGESVTAVQDSLLVVLPASAFQLLRRRQSIDRHLRRKAKIFRKKIVDIRDRRDVSRIDPYLRLSLRDVTIKKPVYVPAEATVSQAAKLMQRENVTTCLVGQEQNVLGIVTEHDILKKIVAQDIHPDTAAIRSIMSSPVITIKPDGLLFEAFSRMVRSGIRRLVVRDGQTKIFGIIEDRDLLSVKGENPVYLAGEIRRAENLTALTKVFDQVQKMVARSVVEGIGILQIGRLTSDMRDQILDKVHDLVLAEMDHPPPASFCLAALGSEGRREQYLATDQDNALIHSATHAEHARRFFEIFADKFIRALLDLGIPPCPHQVMITNPDWRMSIDEWLDTVDALTRGTDRNTILKTSLLSDMRPVAGDAQLAGHLKSYLFRRIAQSPFILKYMANEAVRFKPPVSFFNKFILEKRGNHKGAVDIKKGGVFPITQGVRTLAVEHGVLETSTEERIRLLHDRGVFSAGLSAGIQEAYASFQTLRVRFQTHQVRSNHQPDNFIFPDQFSAMERDMLKDAFKIVAEFQSLLFTKYGLHLLT
ncbi:CBS domain-containing protein [Desulfonatronum thiosulfatophilum]|uniref:CBS domain-containing protein n=1 Tax=Desulfonatronum thiosulfatophilum TaxID=617002 RepID=A0A1G6DQ44_9BACT|nr:putative nucleotidyltransferase substrate binding domain-containing protein [Desulfonatronum thiosulfatophilum]SDB47220.1 CBS domain-containing protein [Desulfonatronum thiosulfatophilum]